MDEWKSPARKWSEPVVITIENLGRQTVHGPYAAAMMLSLVWPRKKGRKRDIAESLCISAAEGIMDPEKAREAFVAAVREAGINLHSDIAWDHEPMVAANSGFTGRPTHN